MSLRHGKDRRTVFRCNYFIANTTRFKRQLFSDAITSGIVMKAFLDAAEQEGVVVDKVDVRASLVLMRLGVDPSTSAAQVFAKIKFKASNNIREQLPELPKMIFAKTFMVTTYGKEDPLDVVEYIDDVKAKYGDNHRRLN